MERHTLGGTGLSVSRVCLGTMTFGGQVDEPTAAGMVDLALDRGVNFLDTANVYTGGRAEEFLGRILGGRRDRVVLASKVGIKVGDAPDDAGLSRAAVEKGVEASLRRLRTDRLDLFYLHQPDTNTPPDETLEAVDRLVRAGKVLHLGVSNYAAWQVCELLWRADKAGRPPVRVVQPLYNLVARGADQELLPMCRSLGLGVVAYNPLAGGLLTGKHPTDGPLAGSRFERMPTYKDRYWHPDNLAAVRELAAAAEAEGRSLIGLSLGWLLRHSPVDSVIVGASRPDQLAENLAAAEAGPMSPAAVEACQRAWAKLRGPSPAYNR